MYEIAHIGTGAGVVPSRDSAAARPGHLSAAAGMTSSTLLDARSAVGFGPEELATSWTNAHECSEWWGDSVILSMPAIAGALKVGALSCSQCTP